METDNFIYAELSQKGKDILLEKVDILKAHISMLESKFKTPIFKRLQLAKIQLELLRNGATTTCNISSLQLCWKRNTELCCEISRFTQILCIKIERNSKCVFEMSNAKDIANKDLYAIEILIDDNGHGKLGKCILPNFINVQNILLQYPIHNLSNVKYFLKSCVRHIDAYSSRQKQIDQMKKLFLEVENAYVSCDTNISLIELTMLGVKDMDTTKFYDVILYLHYNLDETRPYKLFSTTDDIEVPSPNLIRRLNKYFESFLKMDLTLAWLQISEFQDEFIWNVLNEQDESDVEIYEVIFNLESNLETRYELLETISMLKTYISLLESAIETPKLDQSQITKESLKSLHDDTPTISHNELDVIQMELYFNIYQFAKVQCIDFKRDSRFIFEISNSEYIMKNDLYTMEILIDQNGQRKLGKCVLSDFIDLRNILLHYPIDNLNNMKHFLKNRKYNIDCYFCRLNQINELKNLFLKIQNGYVCHNNDVTLIELTMYNVKDVYTDDVHDVIMYLHYHSDETRPYKLFASSNNIKVKSPFVHRRLNMYFIPFLKKNLSPAFMQIINSHVEFIWQKIMVTKII